MKKMLWTLTVVGSVLGGIILILGVMSAESAPQEAAIAAIAIGLSVIPYCLARAVSERALYTKTDESGSD